MKFLQGFLQIKKAVFLFITESYKKIIIMVQERKHTDEEKKELSEKEKSNLIKRAIKLNSHLMDFIPAHLHAVLIEVNRQLDEIVPKKEEDEAEGEN